MEVDHHRQEVWQWVWLPTETKERNQLVDAMCVYMHVHEHTHTHTHIQLVTVVRNVRQAHECLEIGESQQFFDEAHYLLDSMRPSRPLNARCLR